MIKVLFVCLGNICRSPLAEGLFLKHIKENNLESQISCDSAGTAGYHIGELADPRTRKNAESHGVKLIHKARQFSTKDFENFDYILLMDDSNLNNVEYLKKDNVKSKIFKMRFFDHDFKDHDVPDPYYLGEEGFENVYNILDRSTLNFLEFLRKEHSL